MSNNRSEISRRLTELKLEYESLDRFFYSNFKIYSENFTSYIKAKPYACCEYSRRIDLVKNIFQTSGDFATITQVAGLTLKTRES